MLGSFLRQDQITLKFRNAALEQGVFNHSVCCGIHRPVSLVSEHGYECLQLSVVHWIAELGSLSIDVMSVACSPSNGDYPEGIVPRGKLGWSPDHP